MPHTPTHTRTHTGAQPHTPTRTHTDTRTPTEAQPPGFTLVETAIIVIIIGIIAALVIPAITSRITTDRGVQGRGDVVSVRDEIIGFAMVKNAVGGFSLPRQDLSAELRGYMHIDDYNSLPKVRAGDFWSQPFLYRIDEALSNGQNLCYVNDGDLTLNIEQGAGPRTVAFIVKSNGPNMQNDIPDFDDISTVDFNLTIGQAGDDIVEFVTLDYLKGRLSCPSGAPGTPFVALDFSEIADRSELVAHPGVSGAGPQSDVSITSLSEVGNVLDLSGSYGGGSSTNSWVELVDVSDPNDICGYTLMGWFRTPGSVLPERRQYITSRRPSHGGSFNTWYVSINSRTDPCSSSSGFCTQVTPPGETSYGASDAGGGGVSSMGTALLERKYNYLIQRATF
jgi:competence protein ComGC